MIGMSSPEQQVDTGLAIGRRLVAVPVIISADGDAAVAAATRQTVQ